jgi:hypothetical protein
MSEKQASSEIAQSRERFEKWAMDDQGFTLNTIHYKNDRGRYCLAALNDWWDAWQAAERDTRERCAQLDAKLNDFLNIVLVNGVNRVYLERVAKELLTELAERIRGKE